MDKQLMVPILISIIIPIAVVVIMHSGITPGTPLSMMMEIVFISLLPATPLVYGWLTGDARGAIVTGTLPFILVTILVAAFNPLDLFTPGRIGQVLIFLLPLTLIGGLIGFFSSRRMYSWLCLAIFYMFGWAGYFLIAGIN